MYWEEESLTAPHGMFVGCAWALWVSWAWGSRVCWEMLRGRVPPHSPSLLALACLLGPCPRRVDSCPPRSLSAHWWRTLSAGCPVLWAVSFVLHPPFPADRVVPFVFTAVSDAGAVPGCLVTLGPRS